MPGKGYAKDAANPFAPAIARTPMPDFVYFLLFLAAWIALQRFVLPRLGVST